MNFADWLIAGKLLASAHPRYAGGLGQLASLGIVEIVNLYDQPHERADLERHGIAETHIPVPDFTPPSQAQLVEGIRAIESALAADRPVAVHCGAGLGRTGTLLAAYLVHTGVTPAEAIAAVREARPGAIETPEQEAAIAAYALGRHPQNAPGS